jgi:two-component system response regulator VicR
MTSALNILVVEDDPNLGQVLSEYLDIKGFQSELKTDGQEGLKAYKENAYDLLIVDVMMPKLDGFSMVKAIREQDDETPIIFLTAKSMKQDTIEGLKLGADDYITKPFSMEELLLRIKSVLKRVKRSNQESTQYTLGSFTFDVAQQQLIHPSQIVKLTTKEAGLLQLLCQNMNQVLDRTVALKKIWQNDSYFNARSMDVYISKLRKYLQTEPSIEIITVHGRGFKLVSLSKN